MTTLLPDSTRRVAELRGRRVTLMGLGRHGGGLGAARYLARAGARLTISDAAPAEALANSLAALRDFPEIELQLGGHRTVDFAEAEIVVVNPAVRQDHPCLMVARESGARITSEIELLLERCPAHVIGVTGSNGKSTTVTMLFEILKQAGRRAWLGGNLGGSLLGDLAAMTADDWVVLELSSFQLAHLSSDAPLPEIDVITNCTPNHLDWHEHFAAYSSAKQRLLAAERVILNTHDPVVAAWAGQCPSTRVPLGNLAELPTLRVCGAHNRQNAACAAAAARAAGVADTPIRQALAAFTGLEHRIEWVGECDGRHFYNDSKSTSPAATIAALAAMDRPTWLLLGGVAKGTDFQDLAAHAMRHAQGVAAFGEAGQQIAAAFLERSPGFPLMRCESLADAVRWCREQSAAGDAVLLSPACASFDQFADFAARGRAFRDLVRATT